jgi:hypothetical protein
VKLKFDGEGSSGKGTARRVGAVTATHASSCCFIIGERVRSERLGRRQSGGRWGQRVTDYLRERIRDGGVNTQTGVLRGRLALRFWNCAIEKKRLVAAV